MIAALGDFGAPTADVQPGDFTEPDTFFQIGVEPVRIDIMTSVPGLDFQAAWARKLVVDFGGESAPVLCREDALESEIAAGRVRDFRAPIRKVQRPSNPLCRVDSCPEFHCRRTLACQRQQ